MSDMKERSGLFKFFYIVLSVITFPFFAIIYVIKHPKMFLVILLILVGVVVYFPLKDGVRYNNIVQWYKDKLNEAKMKVVTSVVDEDNVLLSDSMAKDIKEMKKDLDSLKKEENMVKGENFNENIKRSEVFEDVADVVRKKGGFKKKGETKRIKNAESLVEEGQKIDGLKGFMLKKEQIEKDKLVNGGDVMLFEDDNEKLGKVKDDKNIELEFNKVDEPKVDDAKEEPVVEEIPLEETKKKIKEHKVFDENMLDDLDLNINEPKKAPKKEEIEAEPEELELF